MGVRQRNAFIGMLRDYQHFFDGDEQRNERYLSPDGHVAFLSTSCDGVQKWSYRVYDGIAIPDTINTCPHKTVGDFGSLEEATSIYNVIG